MSDPTRRRRIAARRAQQSKQIDGGDSVRGALPGGHSRDPEGHVSAAARQHSVAHRACRAGSHHQSRVRAPPCAHDPKRIQSVSPNALLSAQVSLACALCARCFRSATEFAVTGAMVVNRSVAAMLGVNLDLAAKWENTARKVLENAPRQPALDQRPGYSSSTYTPRAKTFKPLSASSAGKRIAKKLADSMLSNSMFCTVPRPPQEQQRHQADVRPVVPISMAEEQQCHHEVDAEAVVADVEAAPVPVTNRSTSPRPQTRPDAPRPPANSWNAPLPSTRRVVLQAAMGAYSRMYPSDANESDGILRSAK
eukprot:4915419-Prymnesium_polylepis.3